MRMELKILPRYPLSMRPLPIQAYFGFVLRIAEKLKEGYDYITISSRDLGSGYRGIKITYATRSRETVEKSVGPDHFSNMIEGANIEKVIIGNGAKKKNIIKLIEQIIENGSAEGFNRPHIQVMFRDAAVPRLPYRPILSPMLVSDILASPEKNPYKDKPIHVLYKDCKNANQLSPEQRSLLIAWLEFVFSDKNNMTWRKFYAEDQAPHFRRELARIKQLIPE